jgi:hypothetical protein
LLADFEAPSFTVTPPPPPTLTERQLAHEGREEEEVKDEELNVLCPFCTSSLLDLWLCIMPLFFRPVFIGEREQGRGSARVIKGTRNFAQHTLQIPSP